MFDHIPGRSNANANYKLHCSFGPLTVALKAGEETHFLHVTDAGAKLTDKPADGAAFTLAATLEAWEELGKPEPRPGFQSLSGMRRARNLLVTGDMIAFNQHLPLLEFLFSSPGDDHGDAPAQESLAEPMIEPVAGRYLRLMFQGRPHRVYFEEAGAGIPLLCLHTAGSDGRQYRHILNDPEITNRFRVIAFDLPWHGKSSPPPGFEREVYELTTEGYMAIVVAIADALQLAAPVVMGCSIGGRVVLHLALHHGARFRAGIGLQSALFTADMSLGDPAPDMLLHRPDIHGPKTSAAIMTGLVAPQSPATERWETLWHYMQGGPGIFHGDLHYYFRDGDLRAAEGEAFRNSPCPLYLLSGEYDVSATPEMGRAVADLTGAAHFEVMKNMGHFPMSENPALFRTYLLPVLDKIAAQSSG